MDKINTPAFDWDMVAAFSARRINLLHPKEFWTVCLTQHSAEFCSWINNETIVVVRQQDKIQIQISYSWLFGYSVKILGNNGFNYRFQLAPNDLLNLEKWLGKPAFNASLPHDHLNTSREPAKVSTLEWML